MKHLFLFKYLHKQNCTLSILLHTISVIKKCSQVPALLNNYIQQVILILHQCYNPLTLHCRKKNFHSASSHETSIFFLQLHEVRSHLIPGWIPSKFSTHAELTWKKKKHSFSLWNVFVFYFLLFFFLMLSNKYETQLNLNQPFRFQEWSTSIFSKQHQYIIE